MNKEKKCIYSKDSYMWDYDYYITECGGAVNINEGTPPDNHYKYCPYCGGKIEFSKENKS